MFDTPLENTSFIILINSSKTQKHFLKPVQEGQKPLFYQESQIIYKNLSQLSLLEIKDNFQISDKLAQSAWQDLKEHRQKSCYAIEMYSGVFFKELKINEYQKDFLQKHLRILDAYYGLLRPFDLVAPYRLDFSYKKLPFNLYNFWKPKIQKELASKKLYSLASQEFTKLLEGMQFTDLTPQNKGSIKKLRGAKLHQILKSHAIKSN